MTVSMGLRGPSLTRSEVRGREMSVELAALGLEDEGGLMIKDARNLSHKFPDVGYAGDLVPNTAALKGLQAKADLISA